MAPHGPLRQPPPPRRPPKPWELEEELDCGQLIERELDAWTLRERFPLMPGQRHVERPRERPLGMRYGEEGEPVGERIGSRVIGLLASHVDSARRLTALGRCLRSVEAQSERPARFLVSTSAADAGLSGQTADIVQRSRCVDEHCDQGPQALPQFEHYRRLRDVIREREEYLEDVWVFLSDDDDLWHPSRTAAFAKAVEGVRRRAQQDVQAVCSCVHLRPARAGPAPASAADVLPLLGSLVVGPREKGTEHVDLCVRYSTFSAFFEEHPLRVLRHPLADVRFGYFVRHCSELPRRVHEESRHSEVTEEDVLDPERTVGPIKVFLPHSEAGQPSPNWMYFYDRVKDAEAELDGTGAPVQVQRPDDERYAADLAERSSELSGDEAFGGEIAVDEELLRGCAAVRQRLDYELLRLPRRRLVVLEAELLDMAASAAQSRPGLRLAGRFGAAAVEAWARAVCFSRCKTFRMEVYLSDFCAVCGRETSLQCSQCRLEKYCSEDCQWHAWNQGHKEACSSRQAPSTRRQPLAAREPPYESVD